VRTKGLERTRCKHDHPPLRSHTLRHSPRGPRTADYLRRVTLPTMLAVQQRGQP
jgi:hypothetical protein